MSEKQHSPLPWKAEIKWCDHGVICGEGERAVRIARVLFSNDAKLIVTAVNFHERLVNALRTLVVKVDGTLQGYGILEQPVESARALLSEIEKG